jgi:hypothetical protein
MTVARPGLTLRSPDAVELSAVLTLGDLDFEPVPQPNDRRAVVIEADDAIAISKGV